MTGFTEDVHLTVMLDDWFDCRLGFDRLGGWLVHTPLDLDRLGISLELHSPGR